MKLLICTCKLVVSWGFKLAKFLLLRNKGHSITGAKMLSCDETNQFLSSRYKGLLLDGYNKRLSVKESYQNLCLSARVGAGKTTQYIIPNVLDKAKQHCSMAIHDPKGEVRELTSGYLQANGYNIMVFNVQDINDSHCFNPCTETRNEVEIEQIAETLIWCGNTGDKESYWNNGATRIVSVLLKCLSFGNPKYYNLPNLYHLLQNFGSMGEGLDEWIVNHCTNPQYSKDTYLLDEWKGALTGNKEAVQSFVGVALTALKSLTNRDLRVFLSRSSYDLSRFRKEKTAVFLITPPEQQKYYSFVTSLFFRSLFNECMRKHHLQGKSLPVYILYDEFGNSYIPDFVSVANTMRGYQVSLSIILQSISQLGFRYGKVGADSIQGAINTHICLSGSDPATSNYFSDLSGRVRERQEKQHSDHNSDYREYNLLNPNEVRTMQDGQVLVVSRNRNPVMLPIRPYYEVRKFRKASQFPAFRMFDGNNIDVDLVDV